MLGTAPLCSVSSQGLAFHGTDEPQGPSGPRFQRVVQRKPGKHALRIGNALDFPTGKGALGKGLQARLQDFELRSFCFMVFGIDEVPTMEMPSSWQLGVPFEVAIRDVKLLEDYLFLHAYYVITDVSVLKVFYLWLVTLVIFIVYDAEYIKY